MIRRTAAILIALVTLLSLNACSSSDDPKEDGAATTTTSVGDAGATDADGSTTTVEGGEAPEGNEDVAPPSTIDLAAFISGSGGIITPDDEACLRAGISDDPTISDFATYDDLQGSEQINREAFYTVVLDCVGFDRASALFMKRYAETSGYTEVELACVSLSVAPLANEDVVALLSGDETVNQILADDVQTSCFEPEPSE